MSEMPGTFLADLEVAHSAARRHREKVDQIQREAKENPKLLAIKIIDIVPRGLLELEQTAAREFQIDLTKTEQIRKFATASVAEWQRVSSLANRHQIYGACLNLIQRYIEDPTLTGVRFARAVCKAFLEALERILYAVALDFEQLQRALPGERFPKEELAKVLTGITATRTSLHTNLRLRRQLDELREGSKQKTIKRERFEQLLLELPKEVLEAWDKARHPLGNLSDVRTKAVRKLEKQRITSSQELELASFADRERLVKRAKSAGLSPQELEVFKLLIRNPKMKYREIAAQLHIKSTSQVGVIKHRIGRKLSAVGL